MAKERIMETSGKTGKARPKPVTSHPSTQMEEQKAMEPKDDLKANIHHRPRKRNHMLRLL